MAKIVETKNYDLFELHPFNRTVKKIDRLAQSMEIHGWLDAYPMHCVRNGNGKLKIKAGHHRFDAARSINLPVKYVICDDKSTIHELERSTTHWSMRDYLESFGKLGDMNYLKLQEYSRKYRIPLNVSLTLLSGNAANFSGWHSDKFKQGDFKVGNPSHAESVGEMVLFCDELGVEFCRNSRFVTALSKVMLVDGIDHDELKKKIKNHIYLVKKQPDVVGYIRMLEEVYNRQRGNKLAIAIQATA